MSYTFLQEQGEESSAECFSDIVAYVQLKTIGTASKSYCSVNATESLTGSQYGTTSEPSMRCRGGAAWMWCAVGFHARTLLSEVRRQKVSTEKGLDCGKKCGEWFAKLDQNTSSWKIRQRCLFEGLDEFSENWPRWGMIQDGECFPLEMLAHNTSVKGCLSFPTVTASWAGRGPGLSNNLEKLRMSEKCTRNTLATITEFGWRWPAALCEKMMMWPIRWTALAPLETARFQQWFDSHGKP